MFDIEINVSGALKGLDDLVKDIRDADAVAAREVARSIVIPAAKAALSYTGARPTPIGMLGVRTGRTRNQVKGKFWKGKDGLTNGAVKVIGDRSGISQFNEKGTASHGRYGWGLKLGQGRSREQLRRFAAKQGRTALPARKMFETVGLAIRSMAERGLVAEFEKNMKMRGYQ